ncbi:hypothetical protein [Mucilaginibacter sp.]
MDGILRGWFTNKDIIMRNVFFCLLLLPAMLKAQSKPDTIIYSYTEIPPEYPGAENKLSIDFLKKVRVPKPIPSSFDTRIAVEFVVEKNGTITHERIIRGNKDIASQFLKQIKSVKWTPGYNKGKPVRSKYSSAVSCLMMASEE